MCLSAIQWQLKGCDCLPTTVLPSKNEVEGSIELQPGHEIPQKVVSSPPSSLLLNLMLDICLKQLLTKRIPCFLHCWGQHRAD